MAHSHPVKEITNRGDAGRVVLAHGALIEALALDPEVVTIYREWRARHEIDPLLAAVRRSGTSVRSMAMDGSGTERAITRLMRALLNESAADRVALEALLRERQVEARGWITSALLKAFQLATYNEINPTDRRGMSVHLGGLGTLAAGKAPRMRGDDIVRNVRWYYRREIKRPPDDLHVLVKEYASEAHRRTEAHSVVRNGIAQAKALLDLIDA
jgi:hypothetical protein